MTSQKTIIAVLIFLNLVAGLVVSRFGTSNIELFEIFLSDTNAVMSAAPSDTLVSFESKLESLGVPVTGQLVASTNLWKKGNLLYGESTGPFFVYDIRSRSVIYSDNEEINDKQRNIMVDAQGNAYFAVNTNGLAKYDIATNTVSVTRHILPNFLRASTRESSDGWIYGATGQNSPTDLFRFNPTTDLFEVLGPSWGYTTHVVLDPTDRYMYYIPDAHGGCHSLGCPVLQYDVRNREHKVIAFLNNVIEPKYGYQLGGTYGIDLDDEGKRLFISMNADDGSDGKLDGFGSPVMIVVHIPEGEASHVTAPRFGFEDVTQNAGIDGQPGLPLNNAYLHTASWGDIDSDGWLDLFAGTFFQSPSLVENKLLLNRNGRFIDSGQASVAIQGRASGSVFADFDNDGDLDLLISNNRQPSFPAPQDEISYILRNDKGVFTDVTSGSGIEALTAGRQVGVLDYNNDGLLDVFVVADNLRTNGKTVLLRNDGNFRFTDVSSAAGIPADIHGLGLAIGDVTNNGWPDIFVAGWGSPISNQHNWMLIANGDGTYRRHTSNVYDWSSFVKGGEDWVSGAAFADLNRDGRLDFVVGHHFGSSADASDGAKIRVYMNRGLSGSDPVFEDITDAAGLPKIHSKSPHIELQDFDNDGWPDIYVGMTVNTSNGPQPLIFQHNGNYDDPTFSLPSGFSLADPHYYAGGPSADFNRDGKLDVFLAEWRSVTGTPTPSMLMQNNGAPGNWLQVRVEERSALMGVGAKIKIFRQGTTQLLGFREISPSFGWSSSQPAIAHFGLGPESFVDVTVEMPFNSAVYKTDNVPANRLLVMPYPEFETTAHLGLEAVAVTDTDSRYIQKHDIVLPAYKTVSTVPAVDFVPYPHPAYAGDPWSSWGGALYASNGKFYSAIGDHLETDGNSYLYEYDPITKKIVCVGDAQTAVNHQPGDPGHGKIHSQINEGSDGYIYMTTYRGSIHNWESSHILRYPIDTVSWQGSWQR